MSAPDGPNEYLLRQLAELTEKAGADSPLGSFCTDLSQRIRAQELVITMFRTLAPTPTLLALHARMKAINDSGAAELGLPLPLTSPPNNLGGIYRQASQEFAETAQVRNLLKVAAFAIEQFDSLASDTITAFEKQFGGLAPVLEQLTALRTQHAQLAADALRTPGQDQA